jgi:NADH:ubiquinone reductase (H+-translocating)
VLPVESGPRRVVVLGGGFAGVNVARRLRQLLGRRSGVEVTLVSRVNYFLMTPLLFEAGSGVLEPRHAVNPIRPLLRGARFVQAEVEAVELDARVVKGRVADGRVVDIPYDHLVLALGGVTNTSLVPGSHHARTFKTLADAIELRNHVIQRFELAEIETDPARRKKALTFVAVGAGLVGTELMAEFNVFVRDVSRAYPRVSKADMHFELIEAGPRIIPELDPDLADYARRVLEGRGVRVRTGTPVQKIDPEAVHLPGGETIDAMTIVVSTGVVPHPLVAALPLEKDKRGRAIVEPTMRSKSRPEVWALGDCASIPDPTGKPYPPLAQHALREARTMARNIAAVLRGGDAARLEPFVYTNKGTLAALGHFKGVGRVYKFKIYGFVAWWVWRTYYLFQMPQWSRRVRIVVDWTIALLFKHDIVQLDLDRGERKP